jgi:hypothetical protein
LKLEELISSGILESYVLGTAKPEEIKIIREMESLYPEIRDEIVLIESSLIYYSEAQTNSPSHYLKNKIQDKIADVSDKAEAKVISFKTESKSRQNKYLQIMAAASVIALICSSAFNFILTDKINKAQNELAVIRNSNNELAEQMDDLQTTVFEKNKELAMIMQPGTKMISLKGMELSPFSHAMIVWNPDEKMVLINSVSLPEPPPGMQYQLWAMVNGKTMNAGVFNISDGSVMLKMQDMPPAQAFAVTLEKMGGSPVPNMNAMYLIGNV